MARKTLWQKAQEWFKSGPSSPPRGDPPPPRPTPEPAPPPTLPPTTLPATPETPLERTTFVNGVRGRLGDRYCTPPQPGRCTDCSGLVCEEYKIATGRSCSCDSHALYRDLAKIESADLQAGDLVFWDTGFSQRHGNRASHVGVYAGNGRVINALNESRGIVDSPLDGDYGGPLLGYRRLPFAAAPTTPGPATSISKSHDFRTLPTITVARMSEILSGYPLGVEASAIHAAVGGRALPVAMSWMESRYGQDANAVATKNPLGLLWDQKWAPGPYLAVNVGGGVTVKLLRFSSWAAAFREWARRMDDLGYKNGVYPAVMTLEQMIFTYVGGPICLSTGQCGNGETQASCRHYLNETVSRLNRYYGATNPAPPATGYTAHTIEGLGKPLYLPTNLPLRTRLTPMGVTGRKGKPLQRPFQVTRHTTNNPGVGTNAWHHAGWQAGGAQGNPGIAVHAYVDDKEVVITVPFNEQGVHSGDWRNQQAIATELTRNADLDRAKAERNAIALDAGLLHALDLNVADNLWPHTDGGHCPQLSMTWPEYERRTAQALAALEAAHG